MTTRSRKRSAPISKHFLPRELAVHKTAVSLHRAVLVPLPDGTIGHESEEAPLEITRLGLGIPGGFRLAVAVGPILGPNAAVLRQIIGPAPLFGSIGQPERFVARLATVHIVHDMLRFPVFVKIRFTPVEQIAASGRDTRAPLGTGL